MMKFINLNVQNDEEYLISHRNDGEAWAIFFEKLSHLDPNQGYSPDLPTEEVEKIFRAKLNQIK
jgi:hypothetical protein